MSQLSRRRFCWFGLALAASVVLLPACDGSGTSNGQRTETSENAASLPLFSPDGSVVAYLFWTVSQRVPLGPTPSATAESVGIRWCLSRNPLQQKEVTIDSAKLNGKVIYLDHRVHMVFSPDSRNLGVVSGKGIQLLDVTSGAVRTIVDGSQRVTSLGWLSKNQIVYGLMSQPGHSLCRRDITRPDAQPEVFHRGPADPGRVELSGVGIEGYPDTWPTEYWSHAGHYCAAWNGSQFSLVEVATGRVRACGGRRDVRPEVVAMSWKRDDSGVLLLSGDRDSGYQALVVDPRTGETLDFSGDFNGAFGSETLDHALYRPGDTAPATQWTADGQYFVVNAFKKNAGFLVRPRPWELIPVGERSGILLRNKPRYQVEIYPTSIPGWVWSQPGSANCASLVDYQGTRIMPVSLGGQAVISPEGNWIAAAVLPSGGVVVAQMPALLPESRPASSAAAP
jgi:hypothetical protein